MPPLQGAFLLYNGVMRRTYEQVCSDCFIDYGLLVYKDRFEKVWRVRAPLWFKGLPVNDLGEFKEAFDSVQELERFCRKVAVGRPAMLST